MKRLIICAVICVYALILKASPAITIKNNNADEDVASYIQDALSNKLFGIVSPHIIITLTQSGDALTIEYNVVDKKATGKEHTNDFWSELDAIIERTANDIKKVSPPATAVISSTSVPAQHVAQTAPANQTPSKSNNSTPIQTTYTNNSAPTYTAQTTYVSNSVSKYTIRDVQNGRATIGGLLTFPDGTSGIIFYWDTQSHRGLAVSLDRTFAQWEGVKRSRDCHS